MSPSALAVLWDLDGTLVDTAELHFQAWVEMAGQLGLPFTRAQFNLTFGRRNPEILRLLFGEHLTDQEVIDLGDRKEELYRLAARDGVPLLPGVEALLEQLRLADMPQAICSSAPRANIDLLLELTGTVPYFATVVAAEDTSRGKPDPEVFLTGARKLGVPPDRCLVIEDAVAGVQAAHAAGMQCIGVTFVGHHSADNLRDAGAALVVPTLDEVTSATVRALLAPGTTQH